MGLLTEKKVLKWDKYQNYIKDYKNIGIANFIKLYHSFKDIKSVPFYWGYEMEYMLIKNEDNDYKLNIIGSKLIDRLSNNEGNCWLPEYANWMIEKIPPRPFSPDNACLLDIRNKLDFELKTIKNILSADEYIIMLTSFPLLGTNNFLSTNQIPYNSFSKSKFVPDNVINPHIRFKTLTENIRKRKGKKINIDIPIFKDSKTKEKNIEMDCMAFGMGSCCTQITIQCKDLDHSLFLYDQLSILSPFLLALSAACPILKGKLSNYNTRWNVIEQSVDDRKSKEKSTKSRYSTINYFLNPEGEKYNDLEDEYDEQYFNHLLKNNIPKNLARHISYLFIRDPIIMYEEDLEEIKLGKNDTNSFFVNINSSNWNNVRLKPPLKENDSWKVEVRVLEMQPNTFENSAFFIFVILLAKTITFYNLNFYVPISRVDENFKKARKISSKYEEYYFKDNSENKTNMKSLSGICKILFTYIDNYLESLVDFDCDEIKKYLEHIKQIASDEKKNTAEKIREFVLNHEDYNDDSSISGSISNELIEKILNGNF